MSESKEKKTASAKVSKVLEKNRKVFAISLSVIVALLVVFIVCEAIASSAAKKNLTAVDEISYSFTSVSSELQDEALNEKAVSTIEQLKPFTKKSGIVGVRANMLAAEISYAVADYEAAVSYWTDCAKAKSGYTSPLAYFNLGACYEQLGNVEAAADAYKKAVDSKNKILYSHASFSYGRCLETLGKAEEALKVYTELNDKNPDDDWAKLAKTRIIAINANF